MGSFLDLQLKLIYFPVRQLIINISVSKSILKVL